MKEIMINTILFIMLIIAGICLAFLGTSYDDVYISNSTKQCVKIVKPDGTTVDCSHKPSKYNVVYVE